MFQANCFKAHITAMSSFSIFRSRAIGTPKEIRSSFRKKESPFFLGISVTFSKSVNIAFQILSKMRFFYILNCF